MAKSWHEYVGLRQAVITGGCVVLAAFITGLFVLAGRQGPGIEVGAVTEGTSVVSTGSGSVNVGVSQELYEKKLEEIGNLRAELQNGLDARRRAIQMAAGVRAAREWAATLVELGPEVAALAQTLERLVAEFEAEFGDSDLPLADDLEIRLAKATLANANQRYERALELIAETDVERETRAGEDQIARAHRAYEIRGDAFYGLRQWRDALASYTRVLRLDPLCLHTRMAVAHCLSSLERRREALEHHNAIAADLQRRIEQEGQRELITCQAANLCNRGSVLRGERRFQEAIEDQNHAVDVFTRLIAEDGRSELREDLGVALLHRALTFATAGDLDEGIADYNKAIGVFTRLVGEGARSGLARALRGRADVLRDFGRLDVVLRDYDRAIQIRMELLQGKAGSAQAADLACLLNSRAVALGSQGEYELAIHDYDQAIEIHTRLVEQEGRSELADKLALVLANRARVFREQGKLERAIQDLSKAIAVRTRLVQDEGRAELVPDLAVTLNFRAIVLRTQGKLDVAIADFDKVVELLGPLAKAGEATFADKLAMANRNREWTIQMRARSGESGD